MVAASGLPAGAAEAPTSETFREILRRVVMRDPKTGMIQTVRARPDSPNPNHFVGFEMRRAEADKSVEVVTVVHSKAGDSVFERYLLKLTPEIEAEATKRQRYHENQTRVLETQKQEVAPLSGGKLRYGMKVEEVERVLGPGQRGEPHQAAGSLTLHYAEFTLHFRAFQLTRVEKPAVP